MVARGARCQQVMHSLEHPASEVVRLRLTHLVTTGETPRCREMAAAKGIEILTAPSLLIIQMSSGKSHHESTDAKERPMRDIRIAAAVCRCRPGDIEHNLAAMVRLCRRAAAQDVQLICFPELSLTGYALGPALRQTALPQNDPVIQRTQQIARDHGLVILAGLAVSPVAGQIHAEHRVFWPDGQNAAYRKLHLAPPEEGVLVCGQDVPLFEACGVRFGIQLCYDAHFPELTTCMALAGAEVIFMPHASPRLTPRAKLASWLRHLPARAFDNGLFVVACNQTGRGGSGLTFPGLALALGPDGAILSKRAAMGEGLLVADLRAERLEAVRAHRMRYFLPRRRPALYRPLCRP